ncbi:MAG: hypoxanthine phosphoribosyltransferase [Planctomycetes bacterium]|nr:hypoxanthine phosphoribosyltransferase [Planctomycetota bacterium]
MATPAFPPFRILLSRDQILRRTNELARTITEAVHGEPLCLVVVIEGARTFARQLQKLLPGNLPLHEVRASSYGSGTVSSGDVKLTVGLDVPCKDRHVLLLEDIVDTGRTIAALRTHFAAKGARSCRVATLLSKPSRRVVQVPLDYIGFEIPDEFVLGYGMDLDGRYRDIPDVVIYEKAVEQAFQQQVAAR